MKNINNFKQQRKNGLVDLTTHQRHLAQSGCSMRSALHIFNTHPILTDEPIRKHEIKWGVGISISFHDIT